MLDQISLALTRASLALPFEVPDPGDGQEPPGFGKFVDVMGWVKWLALGALFFGFVTIAQFQAGAFGLEVSPHLLSMLPYLATVVVLVLISRDETRRKLNAPAALGKPFNAAG